MKSPIALLSLVVACICAAQIKPVSSPAPGQIAPAANAKAPAGFANTRAGF